MDLYTGPTCVKSCDVDVMIVNRFIIYDYKHLNMQHMAINWLLEQMLQYFYNLVEPI